MVHHRRGLRRQLRQRSQDEALAEELARDWRAAQLSERHAAMLAYADRLTRSPAEVDAADVEALRRAGFSDADVLAIAEVTGYYAYVNRVVDGLGVALEEDAAR